jgi:O-antigen biosynthesis protein
MKLFIIKIGKAASIVKRDGVISGGKRVTQSFFSMFKKVGRGDILFITGGVGDSARYRTQHVAEELTFHGFKCSATIQDNPLLSKYADKFKVFIFHRVLFTSNVARLIENVKSKGGEIIFETDDLVFDPKFIKYMDYFHMMNKMEKKLYENGLGGEILRDPYVRTCTTTTSFLADKLKDYGKNVFVVRNKLSKKDLDTCDGILSMSKKGEGETVKLGYFSGTISHNKDFATIVNPIKNLLEKHANLRLFIAGPLSIGESLANHQDRITRVPYVPREKHFENILKVDINLAPLEMNNPFCEAKSELKFFEAGIVEVPTVAVRNRTFSDAIDDGVNGFLADNDAEWTMKLEKLIMDRELRIRLGKAARKKVLDNYSTLSGHQEEYYRYLRKIISNHK